MIDPFLEGLSQSWLPCSWVVVVPLILIGLSSRKARVLGPLALAIILSTWLAVIGLVAPPPWLAGVAIVAGSAMWFRFGQSWATTSLIGVGLGWAWQPCVGEALGSVLNQAQTDPIGALPGLTAFMLGLIVVGLAIGLILGWLLRSVSDPLIQRGAASLVGVLGLLMLTGLYTTVASVLARWSTELWA